MLNRWLNYSLSSKIKNSLIIIATIAMGIGDGLPTQAQLTPDNSLETESSVVTPDVEVKGETAERIDGGAIRDRNLFHSFSEFNVGESQRVYFANPDNIEQIFTRVTGSNPSNILGTLGVDGAADLLLLNPNGILFGENSSLDVEGSFFGTSADSLLFEDGEEFSAVQPESSLLTVSVPLGIQFGDNPGSISVRSPLEVPNGQNFSLVGGDISLSGGNVVTENNTNIPVDGITALGGRVELGSLSTAGTVNFENSSNLSFSKKIPRADITLKNFLIDASGDGGSIAVYSQNLRLIDSGISIGIDSNVELTEAQAGDINIDTTEATILEASNDSTSAIFSSTGALELTDDLEVTDTAGNAGNISINTGSLSITGRSFIFSVTTGAGNAGGVNINAQQFVSLASEPDQRNDITSLSFATGDSADIKIKTPSLSLDNADISTSTGGSGNAGDILIDVANSVIVNNGEIGAFTSGSGNAGNVLFESETANITFKDQAAVRTNVVIGEVSLLGSSLVVIGTGQGGNITIKGRNFSATDNVSISTATEGEATADELPNAGNIELNIADSITLNNNSVLETASAGQGNAGNLTIDTGKLIVQSSAISSGTNGLGQAGNIDIFASDSINLSRNLDDFANTSDDGIAPSSIFSSTFGDTNAGNIAIKTSNLTVDNGAQIQATTFGVGNGGNININADKIKLIGISEEDFPSAIGAITDDAGNGGIINITTNDLVIEDEAGITVRSIGSGDAGSLFAQVRDSFEANNGRITSTSDRSSGGEISLSAGDIRLRGDSDIRTNVRNGEGGGGNITLSADSIVAFDDSDIIASSADGVGGNITLDTDAFFASNFNSAFLNANPDLLDFNNRVDINATGFVNGVIDIPDVNFLPNSLVELSEETIDSDEVVANSCVVRNDRGGGTLIVTGSGGLPLRPGDAAISDYPTGTVRPIPDKQTENSAEDNWQPGDPIVEPEKAYRLSNGKLVLSRRCS